MTRRRSTVALLLNPIPGLCLLLGLCGPIAFASASEVSSPVVMLSFELPSDLPLMSLQETTFARFYEHVTRKNRDLDWYYARRLFETYRDECRTEGVSQVVALGQMIHETDYLLFTGSVRASQYNYAGLGATAPGEPGLSFRNMQTGVRAHVQHLKAYGNRDPLVLDLVDPRFGYVERGSAPTVMGLAGRWAMDPDYGPKLIAHAHRLLLPREGQ